MLNSLFGIVALLHANAARLLANAARFIIFSQINFQFLLTYFRCPVSLVTVELLFTYTSCVFCAEVCSVVRVFIALVNCLVSSARAAAAAASGASLLTSRITYNKETNGASTAVITELNTPHTLPQPANTPLTSALGSDVQNNSTLTTFITELCLPSVFFLM